MKRDSAVLVTATAACGVYFIARALPLLVADFYSYLLYIGGRFGW